MDDQILSVDPDSEQEKETFPIEPRYHPVNRIVRAVYDFLASAKLAMALLLVILACCITGVTIFRDRRAWDVIFSTLWFNGLLVMLIVNVACCFFGRIWGRRVTLVSLGMILFHLSFVTMFAGIIYNGLFYFRGSIRLTEGESLPSGSPDSYDFYDQGRFFNWSLLKGMTELKKVQYDYKVEGNDKRAAYDVSIGQGALAKQQIIYVLKPLEYRGFKYFRDKEGFSVLTILYDKQGKELYGAHISLQSLQQKENTYLYTNGTKDGPKFLTFPQPPANPIMGLNVSYLPEIKKERSGNVFFQIRSLGTDKDIQKEPLIAEGKAAIGAKFNAGEYDIAVKEVRYWAAMFVRYEPGQPLILTSLWVGLFGMTLTMLARIFGKRKKGRTLNSPAGS